MNAIPIEHLVTTLRGRWHERAEPLVDALASADVVVGVDDARGKREVFFVGEADPERAVVSIAFALDFDSPAPDFLSAAITAVKGAEW